jgi:ankyrin repeat protein
MATESQTLHDLDRRLRAIPGARTETRPLADVFEREIAWLLDAHRARVPAAALVIRQARWKLGRPDDRDAAIFGDVLDVEQARHAISRLHWFSSWEEAAQRAGDVVDPTFELAADAIVDGDAAALRALLAREPRLARARSPYAHRATLLQLVAANGIEVSRQWQSPPNAVEIARVLIEGGSEPDATCDAYGPPPGGSTAMGLLVSSAHPALAGVQVALVEALLDAGASVNGLAAHRMTPIETALVFGYTEAAKALERRGAGIDDVVVAAGLGRADLVEGLAGKAGARLHEAFRLACARGHAVAAVLLLDKGADPGRKDNQGFTGLHWAAWDGHLATVEALLERPAVRALLEVKNIYGGTVLDATVWAARNADPSIDRLPVIAKLIASGADVAEVSPRPTGIAVIDALLDAASPRPR